MLSLNELSLNEVVADLGMNMPLEDSFGRKKC